LASSTPLEAHRVDHGLNRVGSNEALDGVMPEDKPHHNQFVLCPGFKAVTQLEVIGRMTDVRKPMFHQHAATVCQGNNHRSLNACPHVCVGTMSWETPRPCKACRASQVGPSLTVKENWLHINIMGMPEIGFTQVILQFSNH